MIDRLELTPFSSRSRRYERGCGVRALAAVVPDLGIERASRLLLRIHDENGLDVDSYPAFSVSWDDCLLQALLECGLDALVHHPSSVGNPELGRAADWIELVRRNRARKQEEEAALVPRLDEPDEPPARPAWSPMRLDAWDFDGLWILSSTGLEAGDVVGHAMAAKDGVILNVHRPDAEIIRAYRIIEPQSAANLNGE